MSVEKFSGNNQETYVTKENPTLGDWLDYNKEFFDDLRDGKEL